MIRLLTISLRDSSLCNGQSTVYAFLNGRKHEEANILQTFIEMTTGTTPPAPLSWEYTEETQEQRDENNRLCEE